MSDRRGARYAAQQNAANVLWELLLVAAEAAGLPPLAWTLPTDGTLVAHVFEGTDAVRRSRLEAWAGFLAARRLPDAAEDGKVQLRVRANDVFGCRVTVIAYLDELANGGGR